ncbi:MAG: ADP-ribosylglycohydrolase family protein [Bryobacteraceae bacterium]
MTNTIYLCAVLALGSAIGYGQTAASGSPNDRLFARIYGSVAAANIGNAMGAPVEGWPWEKTEKTYGFLDKFVAEEPPARADRPVPQRFGPAWVSRSYRREPGWTEDGMERYKLLASAIIRKGGRINVEDLGREWVEKINPAKFGYNLGNQDQVIYNLLKSGMPPWEVGRYAAWPGFIGTSKMIQPIGLVNACRPDMAARDALDVARIKDAQGLPNNYALEVAAAIAAATAEALRPGATVDSIVETALAQLPNERGARMEVQTVLGWARNAKDWRELRVPYARRYEGKPGSNAIEILGGGLACFIMAKGQPKEAILYAVNLGRDTDCKAYTAGGIAGALRGIEAVPREWVDVVEKAVLTDPHTVDKRTARQLAEGIYAAALNEHRRGKTAGAEVDSLLAK